jgi:hypothetical protein
MENILIAGLIPSVGNIFANFLIKMLKAESLSLYVSLLFLALFLIYGSFFRMNISTKCNKDEASLVGSFFQALSITCLFLLAKHVTGDDLMTNVVVGTVSVILYNMLSTIVSKLALC